jgi:hypothetical protein
MGVWILEAPLVEIDVRDYFRPTLKGSGYEFKPAEAGCKTEALNSLLQGAWFW